MAKRKNYLTEMLREKYYSSAELCEVFHCSTFTLFRWVNLNMLPDFPPYVVLSKSTAKNAKRYWERDKVEEWLKTHEVTDE